jgi:hypothetical protein
MGRIVAVLLAAVLGPFVFVAAYLLIAHLAHWTTFPAVVVGGTLAGVAPILLTRGSMWLRGAAAAIYALPCAYAVSFYWLLLNCSMFRQCLS